MQRLAVFARSTLALAAVVVLAAPASAAPETMKGLAAHRAVYEMSLDKRSDRAEVIAVGGRLVYEFSGTVCDGFASRFRLVTRLTNTDGTSRVSDMRTTSYEDGAGKSFDFLNQNLVDSQKVEDTKGVARHDGGKTLVEVATPQTKSIDLPGSVKFPTEHMAAILEAAQAGRSVVEIDLFDGSEGGARLYHTTVVIGHAQPGADDTTDEPAAAAAHELLDGKRRWTVSISYFDPDKGDTDATPEYQLSFLLYENGVSRHLRLDYGEFTLAGTLSSLTALPSSPCK